MSDSVWPHRWQPTRLRHPWDSPGKSTGMGCHFLLQCMKVKSEREVAQSCLTLSDPMDCSPPGDTRDLGSMHCSGRSSGGGNGNLLQCSCLENLMDGGAWWATVHGVAKSWTRQSGFTFTFPFHALDKEMATHSSVLAWRIPGMGEPGGLPSLGSHRVGHD